MSWVLAIIGWALFGVAVVLGLFLDMLGLFGNWVILLAVGCAAVLSGFDHFGGWTLVVLLGLATLGEILEALSAGVGAARYGGGKGAMAAAVVGCILGALGGSVVFPIVGTIVGACLGAFGAAALYEYLNTDKNAGGAFWVGVGAAIGKVGGLFAKTLVGVLMLGVCLVTY